MFSCNFDGFILSESTNRQPPPLFHISFRDHLDGLWTPRLPDGNYASGDKETGEFPEPKVARISFSSSLEGCFYAIYHNISQYFEINKYPYMDFFVYSPILTGNEKIWNPQFLTKKRLVHDAHVTNEYCILTPVKVKCIGKLRVFNPLTRSKKIEEVKYFPFNDRSLGERFLSYKVETRFVANKK